MPSPVPCSLRATEVRGLPYAEFCCLDDPRYYAPLRLPPHCPGFRFSPYTGACFRGGRSRRRVREGEVGRWRGGFVFRPGCQSWRFLPRGSTRRHGRLLRFQHPLPEPCMRFSLTRLAPGQSVARIPLCQSRWRSTQASPTIHRPGPFRERATDPFGNTRSLLRFGAHPAGDPSLRRVLLSTPSSLLWPPPTSARRSLTSRLLTAYRVRRYRPARSGKLRARVRRCQDGSLLFHGGLCNRSAPSTPSGS